MLLSILVPTLEERCVEFAALSGRIRAQIDCAQLQDRVELLSLRDNRETPTGVKRNQLLQRASGDFVVFVDDDDDISADYIKLVCQAIESQPDVDCIGIRGLIYFRGSHPHRFVHSLQYQDYSSKGGVYTRPPYHLNPIRREIASSYRFRDVYYSEDIDWALRLRQDERLRSEVFIDSDLYFYYSRRFWTYQWTLDRTETLRHKFGLRLTNRFQIYTAARKAATLTKARAGR
jgi:glycosyltransferase involved in cell wall biosynthesis